jgi:hypothetical protein
MNPLSAAMEPMNANSMIGLWKKRKRVRQDNAPNPKLINELFDLPKYAIIKSGTIAQIVSCRIRPSQFIPKASTATPTLILPYVNFVL